MTSPLGNFGLKRTTSRPLPPTILPPPQSQNNCADAGPASRPAIATTAPTALPAWRSKRAMLIVANSRLVLGPRVLPPICACPSEQCVYRRTALHRSLPSIQPPAPSPPTDRGTRDAAVPASGGRTEKHEQNSRFRHHRTLGSKWRQCGWPWSKRQPKEPSSE